MKVFKIFIPVLLLIFSFQNLSAGTPTSAKDGIKWYNLEEGLPLAKEQNKFVFIDFYTSWCGYCKKMDRDVFSKKEVIDLLNDDFIAVKIDGDSQKMLEIDGFKISERDLAKSEFKVKGYPTFWWLTPSGKKLHSQSGYAPADFWINALNTIKAIEVDSLGNAILPQEENN